ncbi:MAG: choice-of-anchor D domain-containing protein [Bacteroidetes bacterium]|nr:choice-of-anchor D domain-containing protein [Bacteroidota bacterium]
MKNTGYKYQKYVPSLLVAAALLLVASPLRAQISDVSDAVFSIVVPRSAAQAVDMGLLQVGGKRDSLLVPFVRNTGPARIRIDAISIEGADASSFSVIAGQGPVFVPAGDGHPTGFAFHPSTPGVKLATIAVFSQIDTQYYSIRGEAYEPRIALETVLIDFGVLPLGAQRDSTLVMVRNLSAGQVEVLTAEQGGPDLLQYSVIDGAAPFTLSPLGTHAMTLRFEARSEGRSSGSIDFTVDGGATALRALLFGEGVARDATATLATDTLSAAAGEIVSVPIRLRDARDVLFTGARAFTTELRFRASLLVPIGGTPKGSIDGADRVIPLDDLPLQADADGVLARYDFMAVLGDVETTPLTLSNSAAIGASFPVFESPGFFRLTDICREGGDRLFDAQGTLRLAPNRPNPFNASTQIEYETIEAGFTELYVTDLHGRRLATLHAGSLPPGTHSAVFDAADFPSGSYLVVLRTVSQTLMRRIQLIK